MNAPLEYKANTIKIIILTTDIFLSVVSFIVAFLLLNQFSFVTVSTFWTTLGIVAMVRVILFKWFRTYAFIIRYLGLIDIVRLTGVLLFGSVILFLAYQFDFLQKQVTLPVLIVDLILVVLLLSFERFLFRYLHESIFSVKSQKSNLIIFGAGESGNVTVKMLKENQTHAFKVIAIFDDNPKVHNKTLNGVPVYNFHVFENIIKNNNVTHAIISVQNLPIERKRSFIELCLKNNLLVQQVPPASKWLNGSLEVRNIQNINVEELLSRPPIRLNYENIGIQLRGKIILVTGAAGSIGSEIVRQCIKFEPERIILLDQAESPLVEIGLEIAEQLKFSNFETIVADVADIKRVRNVFLQYRPHIVFHAAAYKHVPMMELQPSEAVKVNIKGTKNVADISVEYGVQKFVMISTDKAVNPTNVMGASKRIAEIYIQSLNSIQNTTQFITTRFGNVLGSNGSVLLRFKKQIESKQPITVTHPDIIRYFMTIPEACQLVLEAGNMGNGGEIFIFDMGEPVKILDLAINTIKLAGLRPYQDIDIVFSGLRPGEKLTEELLNDQEQVIPTHHDKIKKAKVRQYDYDKALANLNYLISKISENDETQIVKIMKEIVPEFISNNSIFSELDEINRKSA